MAARNAAIFRAGLGSIALQRSVEPKGAGKSCHGFIERSAGWVLEPGLFFTAHLEGKNERVSLPQQVATHDAIGEGLAHGAVDGTDVVFDQAELQKDTLAAVAHRYRQVAQCFAVSSQVLAGDPFSCHRAGKAAFAWLHLGRDRVRECGSVTTPQWIERSGLSEIEAVEWSRFSRVDACARSHAGSALV